MRHTLPVWPRSICLAAAAIIGGLSFSVSATETTPLRYSASAQAEAQIGDTISGGARAREGALPTTAATPDLARLFANPPASTKPWVYWYWINGSISKDGISADLRDMARVGIGGAFIMDGSIYLPPGPVRYGSDAWHAHVQHAIAVGAEVGVEIGIMNCAGWATSGGPWNDLDQSMKQLVWSETIVAGGARWRGRLAEPEAVKLAYFRDVAVLAVREHAGAGRVANLEAKTGLKADLRATLIQLADLGVETGVAREDVVDLTDRVASTGEVEWTPPAGRWTILRFGYTTTGRKNHPAPPEGTGYEVDKLDATAVRHHLESALGRILREAGPHVGTSLTSILCDSWEAGTQNWTALLPSEFERRRGYVLRPWLPCLAGRVVGSAAETEAFLEDFRRTLGDLYAENYFQTFQQFARSRGMRVAAESYGGAFDELKMHRFIDLPMVEFWMHGLFKAIGTTTSAARTLGTGIVMAEAFTSRPPLGRWLEHPASLKAMGDAAQAAGVNRFALHCYAHQPRSDLAPGFTLGRYGSHFGRLNSWWPLAPSWLGYVRRSHALLQFGETVADVLHVYPERLQNEQRDLSTAWPRGYHGTAVAPFQLPDVTVAEGALRLPHGGSYRVLLLPDHWTATIETLQELARLRDAGARIMGPPPFAPATLRDVHGRAEWDRRVGGLFAKTAAASVTPEVLGAELRRAGARPDLEVAGPDASADVRFIHRRSGDVDVFFVTNQSGRSIAVDLIFRAGGRVAELWNPVSGRTSDALSYVVENGTTRIGLSFDPADAVFVIFQRPLPTRWPVSVSQSGQTWRQPVNALRTTPVGGYVIKMSDGTSEPRGTAEPAELPVSGPWTVTFEAGRGAPVAITLAELTSLAEHADAGVRHFSGLMTYRTSVTLAESPARPWSIDLGAVGDLAQVTVNGRELGTVWRAPYVLEVGGALRTGENTIEIVVANRWANRLIGDEQRPADAVYDESNNPNTRGALQAFPDWWHQPQKRSSGRIAAATWRHFAAGDPLVPSGLIGPVRLIAAE